MFAPVALEIGIDATRNGCRHAPPPAACSHRRLVRLVGKIANFNQNRRNVGCLENPEASKSVGLVSQVTNPLQLWDEQLCQFRGIVLGFTLCEVDQDAGDDVGFLGEIDARNDVGLVFRLGQRFSLAVGCLLGECVDRSARGRGTGSLVGVDGDEKVSPIAAANGNPGLE